MLGGDPLELLAVALATVDFVKAGRRVARPTYYGGAGENVVHERSGLSAVKQASAILGFQTNNHNSTLYCWVDIS